MNMGADFGGDAWWSSEGVELCSEFAPEDRSPGYVGLPFRRPASAPVFRPDPGFRFGSGYRACGLPAGSPGLAPGLCSGCLCCDDLGADFQASGVRPI